MMPGSVGKTPDPNHGESAMFTFQVPIAKLGRSVPVTLSGESALHREAAHGLKQRCNDATASFKRSAYDDEDLFRADVEFAVAKTVGKIESDTVGVRVPKAPTPADNLAKAMIDLGVTADEVPELIKALRAMKAAA